MKFIALAFILVGTLFLWNSVKAWRSFFDTFKRKRIQFWTRTPDTLQDHPVRYCTAMALGFALLILSTLCGSGLLYIGITNLQSDKIPADREPKSAILIQQP